VVHGEDKGDKKMRTTGGLYKWVIINGVENQYHPISSIHPTKQNNGMILCHQSNAN
jgi:hypothetical protein